jgi:hypothetical protein
MDTETAAAIDPLRWDVRDVESSLRSEIRAVDASLRSAIGRVESTLVTRARRCAA